MGMALLASAAAAAAGAGVQAYETNRTAKRQDNEAARSIQLQSQKQKQADQLVQDQVDQMATSDASAERAQRLAEYMQVVRGNRGTAVSGLGTPAGGATFQRDAATAANGADAAAATRAGLMARIDAPQMQRQGEAFGYGQLGTDLSLIGRESAGQAFVDQLRLRQIQRRPGMDLLAGGLSAAGNAMASRIGAGGSTGPATSLGNNNDALFALPGAKPRYGYGVPRGTILGG